jgi:glutathione synthase
MKKPHLLWITDPWHTLDHPRDTTLRLMQEAWHLGVKQYWSNVKSIRLEEGQIALDAKQLLSCNSHRDTQRTTQRTEDSFVWGETLCKSPHEFSMIHYRTDPPVDLAYQHPLQLLALASAKNTEMVNPLSVLLQRNEKMEATALGAFMPASVISSQWDVLERFGKKQRRTVLKPLHEAQSHGIELLDWSTDNNCQFARLKLAEATQQFQTPIMLQVYLEGIAEGETRLWFLDGRLLAPIKKLPLSGDFRVNIDRGSQLASASLSKLEQSKIPKISRHLQTMKIRLAAVDLIEGYITDFNLTSPGLIVQMEAILNQNLAQKIIKTLLGKL